MHRNVPKDRNLWFFDQWYDFDLELCNFNILVSHEYEPRQGVYYEGCQGDGVQMIINKKIAGTSLRRVNFEGSVKEFIKFIISLHIGRLRLIGWETFRNLFKECQKEFEPQEVEEFDENPFSGMLPYYIFW